MADQSSGPDTVSSRRLTDSTRHSGTEPEVSTPMKVSRRSSEISGKRRSHIRERRPSTDTISRKLPEEPSTSPEKFSKTAIARSVPPLRFLDDLETFKISTHSTVRDVTKKEKNQLPPSGSAPSTQELPEVATSQTERPHVLHPNLPTAHLSPETVAPAIGNVDQKYGRHSDSYEATGSHLPTHIRRTSSVTYTERDRTERLDANRRRRSKSIHLQSLSSAPALLVLENEDSAPFDPSSAPVPAAAARKLSAASSQLSSVESDRVRMKGAEGGERSSGQSSKSRSSKVTSLGSPLKTTPAPERSDSDKEPSAPSTGKMKQPITVTEVKDSRPNSHRPYNVIFESDEGTSVDDHSDEESRPGSRGGPVAVTGDSPVEPTNGPKKLDHVSTAIVSLKEILEYEATGLRKTLDVWYGELRQALVDENAVAWERKISEFDKLLRGLMKNQEQDVERLQADVDSLHRLCRSYSRAIRERDKTISKLADSLAAQKEQTVLARSFAGWRSEVDETRREQFQMELATRFYQRKLMQGAWNAWHGVIRDRWRVRVEKSCRKRAEEVCMQMADSYDSKISDLEGLIKLLRQENVSLKEEVGHLTKRARSALIHGVSVLKTDLATFPKVNLEDTSDPSSGNQSSHPNSGTGESGKTQQTFVRNATEAKTFVRDQRETAASPQSLVREAADTRTMVRPTGDRKQSVPAPAHRNRPMRTGSLQYIVEKHSKETHSSGANSASSGTDNRTGLASAPSN